MNESINQSMALTDLR